MSKCANCGRKPEVPGACPDCGYVMGSQPEFQVEQAALDLLRETENWGIIYTEDKRDWLNRRNALLGLKPVRADDAGLPTVHSIRVETIEEDRFPDSPLAG